MTKRIFTDRFEERLGDSLDAVYYHRALIRISGAGESP